jgi:acyl-CoA synthetase (NDP forming)
VPEREACKDQISITHSIASTGPDKNSYYHEKFLRGKPELAQTIPRMDVKGKGPPQTSGSFPPDPNFYAMPFLPIPSASTGSKPHAVSSTLGTAHSVQETGAGSIVSITGGYAAVDPTLSVVVARGLPIMPFVPTEGTLLQLWLQELNRLEQQQQLRNQIILSTLEQDRMRLDQTTRFAALSTPQLLDAINSSSYPHCTTIGHCALALARARARARAARNDRAGMF